MGGASHGSELKKGLFFCFFCLFVCSNLHQFYLSGVEYESELGVVGLQRVGWTSMCLRGEGRCGVKLSHTSGLGYL